MSDVSMRLAADGTLVPLTTEEIAQRQRDADAAANAAAAVPQQVPMWAAQAALKQAGKYDAINAAIVPAMEVSNPPVFFAWTMGNFASRQSAFIGTLASQFDIKDTDIDAVFVAADKIAQTAG